MYMKKERRICSKKERHLLNAGGNSRSCPLSNRLAASVSAKAAAAAQEKDDPQAAVVSASVTVAKAAAATQKKDDPQTAVVAKSTAASSHCGITAASTVCST